MNLEELFVEKYKRLEKKVECLEEQLNEKNKIILETAIFIDDIRENMWIEENPDGGKWIYFFGTPCLFEKYDKEKFDKIVKFFCIKKKGE